MEIYLESNTSGNSRPMPGKWNTKDPKMLSHFGKLQIYTLENGNINPGETIAVSTHTTAKLQEKLQMLTLVNLHVIYVQKLNNDADL